MTYGIDVDNIRRDRFARSPLAGHLRALRELTYSTLICYAVVFAPVPIIWAALGGNK
jgi:hypothetical protein